MRDELDPLDPLTAHDERALFIERLRYALAGHIPAVKRCVRISTGYGPLEFHGPQARKITALCEDLLQRQLQRLQRQGRPRR